MTARRDYSLLGAETKRAHERGLVSAQWYMCDVPRKRMKELMQRSDHPALERAILWYALILGTGALAVWSWGSWWGIPAFFLYGTIVTGAEIREGGATVLITCPNRFVKQWLEQHYLADMRLWWSEHRFQSHRITGVRLLTQEAGS